MFLPGLLMYYGVLSPSPQIVRSLAIAGLLGPTLSGLIMTAVTEGRPGIGQLLRRIVRWRVGLRWYLFTLVGLPILMVLGTIIRPAALESLDISTQPFTLAYLKAFVSMIIIGGPLFEEPGWSGFAQPRLQRLYGPFVGGLLLGSLWAPVAPARILDSIRRLKGYTPTGHHPRLRRVRPRPDGPPPHHHVGSQQNEE